MSGPSVIVSDWDDGKTMKIRSNRNYALTAPEVESHPTLLTWCIVIWHGHG